MNSTDTTISICIARVFKNISRKRMLQTLNELQLGDIERIDLVSSKNPKFNTAFIHYHRWNPNKMEIRQAIMTGKRVKVIYEDPWFWLLSLSRSTKPVFETNSVPKIVITSNEGTPQQQTMERYMVSAGTPPPSSPKQAAVNHPASWSDGNALNCKASAVNHPASWSDGDA